MKLNQWLDAWLHQQQATRLTQQMAIQPPPDCCLPAPSSDAAIAFSPDGTAVYFQQAGEMGGWQLATGRPIVRWPVVHKIMETLAVSPNGKWLGSVGDRDTFCLYALHNATDPIFLPIPLQATRRAWEAANGDGYHFLNCWPMTAGWSADSQTFLTLFGLQYGPDGGPGPSYGAAAYHCFWWRVSAGRWQLYHEQIYPTLAPLTALTLWPGTTIAAGGVIRLDVNSGQWLPPNQELRTPTGGQQPLFSKVGRAAFTLDDAGAIWQVEATGQLTQLTAPPTAASTAPWPANYLALEQGIATVDQRQVALHCTQETRTATVAAPLERWAYRCRQITAYYQSWLFAVQLAPPQSTTSVEPWLRWPVSSRSTRFWFTPAGDWLLLGQDQGIIGWRTER